MTGKVFTFYDPDISVKDLYLLMAQAFLDENEEWVIHGWTPEKLSHYSSMRLVQKGKILNPDDDVTEVNSLSELIIAVLPDSHLPPNAQSATALAWMGEVAKASSALDYSFLLHIKHGDSSPSTALVTVDKDLLYGVATVRDVQLLVAGQIKRGHYPRAVKDAPNTIFIDGKPLSAEVVAGKFMEDLFFRESGASSPRVKVLIEVKMYKFVIDTRDKLETVTFDTLPADMVSKTASVRDVEAIVASACTTVLDRPTLPRGDILHVLEEVLRAVGEHGPDLFQYMGRALEELSSLSLGTLFSSGHLVVKL
jgi:hypothetical protein